MCTSLFVYDFHPALLLLLAFNRDEFWDRPTEPAHFWPDHPDLLAGRDALRHGTWLGITKSGRFAFLTNYREPLKLADAEASVAKSTAAPSRGALTTDFLTGTTPPLEYLQELNLQEYCGFNLLVGDLPLQQVAYVSNRGKEGPKLLPPGLYGVSNGLLQEWPKVQRGMAALAECIGLPPPTVLQETAPQIAEATGLAPTEAAAGDEATAALVGPAAAAADDSSPHLFDRVTVYSTRDSVQQCSAGDVAVGPSDDTPEGCGTGSSSDGRQGAPASAAAGGTRSGEHDIPWQQILEHVLGDTRKIQPGEVLPLTGVGEDLDKRLSSVFLEPFKLMNGKYGTRSQTVIAVWRDGHAEYLERYVEQQTGHTDGGAWKEVKHSFDLPNAAVPQ